MVRKALMPTGIQHMELKGVTPGFGDLLRGPPGVWGFWFLGCWGVTLKYPLSSAKSIMAWWV
jgi:hypothetical protein